jgi:hypothetical protein
VVLSGDGAAENAGKGRRIRMQVLILAAMKLGKLIFSTKICIFSRFQSETASQPFIQEF